MKRLNNKGITTIEVIVSFVIVVIIIKRDLLKVISQKYIHIKILLLKKFKMILLKSV